MSIDATSQTNATSTPATQTGSSSGSTMNENDFLQLLVAQLKYQDPMSPTDTNSFVQEQAQFSTVEGINNLQNSMQMVEAMSMMGLQVTYTAADGSSASGVVSGVDSSSGSLALKVGDTSVDPSKVVSVASPADGADG